MNAANKTRNRQLKKQKRIYSLNVFIYYSINVEYFNCFIEENPTFSVRAGDRLLYKEL